MGTIQCIAFDLDDTLLDTSQILVPVAARRACECLLAAGVQSDIDTCLKWRTMKAAELSHSEIFAQFIKLHGSPTPELALQNALKAFYNPDIPERLPLIEGAEKNLKDLSNKYKLFLVSSGEPAAQMKKIKALDIENFFHNIYLVNPFKNEQKKEAFADILRKEKIEPTELLSIGNRLSQEIRHAKLCGALTCYFCHGEHVGERPEMREDYPDFTVFKHSELISVCSL